MPHALIYLIAPLICFLALVVVVLTTSGRYGQRAADRRQRRNAARQRALAARIRRKYDEHVEMRLDIAAAKARLQAVDRLIQHAREHGLHATPHMEALTAARVSAGREVAQTANRELALRSVEAEVRKLEQEQRLLG
jgi:hypothetical protein